MAQEQTRRRQLPL